MASPHASSADFQPRPSLSAHQILVQHQSKFKERSFATSKNEHIALLGSLPEGPQIVLLGDSMIERMQTTGQSASLQPWPSASILTDADLESERLKGCAHQRLDGVFHAGVGGDKYENILYRLHGDEERQLPGLLDTLRLSDINLWLIHAGTNNLHPKRGLSDASVEVLRLVLESILAVSTPQTKILLSGLFYRTDIADHLVDEANMKLECLVNSQNDQIGLEPRLYFMRAPDSVRKEVDLEDHVHLNEKGLEPLAATHHAQSDVSSLHSEAYTHFSDLDIRGFQSSENVTEMSERTSPHKGIPIATVQPDGPVHLDMGSVFDNKTPWRLPAARVINRDIWWFLSWLLNIVVALTPCYFIVIAIIAIRLDHKPKSDYGETIIMVTQLGPTIFPIVFASIVGHFCRNYSRWRLEKPDGIKLGVLEQIASSQSLSSALEKAFTVRSMHLLPLLILLIWALSPLGGQSSLRLLNESQDSIVTHSTVYYTNPDYQESVFDSGSGTIDYKTMVNIVYSSALFSVPSKRAALVDPWERPKLRQFTNATTDGPDLNWQEFNQDSNDLSGEDFASLLGMSIEGLRTDDPTLIFDFKVNSSYMDVECERVNRHKTGNGSDTVITQGSFNAALQNYTATRDPLYWFWNTKRTGHRFNYDSRMSLTVPQNIPKVTERYAFFECVTRRIPIEAVVACGPFPSTGCRVIRQRYRADKTDPAPSNFFGSSEPDMYQILPWSMVGSALYNMLQNWPAASGTVDPVEEASATDNFLAGDTYVYNSQRYRDWDTDAADMSALSRRMTTLFNTILLASLNPWNATTGDVTRTPDMNYTTMSIFQPVYNTTEATLTRQQDVYQSDRTWCAILLVISILVQLLAITSLWLRALINTPDILGFASSLTRDNAYFPLQSSGSALGGAERARLMKDVRVQITDVLPFEPTGYIAFTPVTGDLQSTSDQIGNGSLTQRSRWPFSNSRRLYQ
ncbi:hypothetical protein E8E14_013960 [Neopestalotiopsis sp. 37M]|nr:hypothetical protein E8E14_013960 [Neopestalotiopsis sp. 37M]